MIITETFSQSCAVYSDIDGDLVKTVGEDSRFALSYAVSVNTVMMLNKENWISD